MVTIEINIQREYREFEGKSLEEWYGKKYLKNTRSCWKVRMKKSIFKASFEESLNLEDDGFVKLQQEQHDDKTAKFLRMGILPFWFRIRSLIFIPLFFLSVLTSLCWLYQWNFMKVRRWLFQ